MSYGAAAVGLTVVLAQGSPQLASSTGPASAPRSLLAEQPVGPTPGRAQAREATRLPDQAREIRVVCGTTVVTADARVDPRMPRLTAPADVAYTIRATPPPICRD